MSRHGSRELALQALYHLDLNRVEWGQAVAMTRAMMESVDYDDTYLTQLMRGITDHQEMIDKILDRYSQDWDVDRMPGVTATFCASARLNCSMVKIFRRPLR
ncbi:hypothetical protein ATW55_08165 [Ferroacidibacillus organovorans]|uniref:NusB/RsmB/TIM44 domain-containing protein n=1 Tax=Ferroacidibacillus organovorans TaxID=1765683 RepID=A0A124IWA4_9BACL|nr:hypothetical protein ATW55_08165 [Ferroacidibacillus organovorans]